MGEHVAGTPVRTDVRPATCTSPTRYTEVTYCVTCSYVMHSEEKLEGAVLDHSPVAEWSHDSEWHWHACETCDNRVQMAQHTIENGVCTGCGAYISTDGITYTLNEGGQSYTCTGGSFAVSDIFIAAMYNGKPVTRIADRAFAGKDLLRSVSIPDTVTHIGEQAFQETNLTSITLPDSVTTIGNYAFYDCNELTTAVLSQNLTAIPDYAFTWCDALASVNIPNKVQSISELAFSHTAITTLTIPASVKSIEMSAFWDCTNLQTLTIEQGVTSIGEQAFLGCEKLATVALPEGLTHIGARAFAECGIVALTIPASVESMGYNVFSGCEKLQTLTVCEGVTRLGEYAFSDASALTTVILPSTLRVIGGNAFYGCTSLESIAIPDGVTEIQLHAFNSCSSLVQIALPNTLTEIGLGFEHCDSRLTIYYNGTEEEWSAIEGVDIISIPHVCYTAGKPVWVWEGYTSAEATLVSVEGGVLTVTRQTGTAVHESSTAATCTTDGKNVYAVKVTFDGEEYSDTKTETLTATGHNYGKPAWVWDGYTSATATFICANDSAHVETQSADAVKTEIKAATCTTDGENEYVVTVTLEEEEYSDERTEIVSAGHTTDNGICDTCGVVVGTAGLSYRYDGEAGYTVTGYTGSAVEIYIPDTYDNGSNGEAPVVGIAQSAFSKRSITKVYIPASVKKIGNTAFQGCQKLGAIHLPAGLSEIGIGAFLNCTSLTSVEIPESVTLIENQAFSGCSELASVNIPQGLKAISPSTFSECTSLTEIKIPAGVTEIGNDVFMECGALKTVTFAGESALTRIGDKVFYNCSVLTAITIPAKVTSIGTYAFYGCSALTSVVIPAGVTELSERTFSGCFALETVTFAAGSKLASIGNSAFSNCDSLIEIAIPAGVTSIGSSVFRECKALTAIDTPAGVTDLG